MASSAKESALAQRIAAEFAKVPLVLKYNTATSSWPARPNTTRVVFWLALSESVPDPTGLQIGDLVFKGANP